MQNFQPYQTASEKAGNKFLMVFITCVILAGVLFSDIIFFMMIQKMFPAGIMQAVAIVGAITTGASVLLLYWGKQKLFRPGGQIIGAWCFTGIEVLVMIMNDVLYFTLISGGHLDDTFMTTWKVICPATPVISVIGWLIIVFLDPAREIHHKRMEMHDEIAGSEIDYQRMLHRVQMQAKYQAMSDMGSHLAMIIQEESQPALIEGARKTGSQIVSSLTNTPLIGFRQARQLPSRIVDADPNGEDYEEDEVEVEQAASRDHVLDRTNVQEKVDNEVKPLERKSWKDKIKETINFSVPDDKPILEEKPGQAPRTRRLGGDKDFTDQEETIDTTELPENYLDWSDKQWKQAKEQLDEGTYNELFDDAFPPEGLKPTPKKKAAPKKPASKKKVSRRQVLKMGKQDA